MEKELKNIAIISNFNVSDKLIGAMNTAAKLMELGCSVFTPIRGLEKVKENCPDMEDKITFLSFDKLGRIGYYRIIEGVSAIYLALSLGFDRHLQH